VIRFQLAVWRLAKYGCAATRDAEQHSTKIDEVNAEDDVSDTKSKQWCTPKLRVFVRTKAEEMVLNGCKLLTTSSGPGNLKDRCLRVTCTPSFPCSSVTGT